jgi:hypothetical protein
MFSGELQEGVDDCFYSEIVHVHGLPSGQSLAYSDHSTCNY